MTRMLPRLAIKKNDMATKVNEVKNQVIWLKEYWRSYICGEEDTIPQQLQVRDKRTTVPCFQEASVIGRGPDKQRIVAMLLSAATNITQGPPSCIILPIFGLAGSGKTTLAKMIFNDTNYFLQEYNFRLWVHVSPKFDIHRICEYIISQVVSRGGQEDINSHSSNSERYLARLHGLLNGKKVLLVLDDLWEQDSTQLQLLKSMLTALGDKLDVIVTTCNRAIDRKICTVEPYRLTPLGNDACWQIIKKSIRLKEHDEELEKIGREIASKCCGVPSVAGAYAEMLHSLDPTRWEEVMERNIWRCCSSVDSTSHSLLSTFGLSYISMPPELRLCFDYYCAIFPNGHTIVKDDLIRQWTALHLIESSESLSATQIAEVYITSLLDMSFLQTAKSDPVSNSLYHRTIPNLSY
jgi:adenylate kinase family enzyme